MATDVTTFFNVSDDCGCEKNIINMDRGNITLTKGKYCRFGDTTLTNVPLYLDGDVYVNLAAQESLKIYSNVGITLRSGTRMIKSNTTQPSHVGIFARGKFTGTNCKVIGHVVAEGDVTVTNCEIEGSLKSLYGNVDVTGSTFITSDQPVCTLFIGCCHFANGSQTVTSSAICASYAHSLYDGNNVLCTSVVVASAWTTIFIIAGLILVGLIGYGFYRGQNKDSFLDK